MASLLLREARAGNSGSRLSYDMPTTPYISGIAEQAQHIQALQERVSELEEALKRERHRADLCQQQLEQCISAAAAQAASANAASAAATAAAAVAVNSPLPLPSPSSSSPPLWAASAVASAALAAGSTAGGCGAAVPPRWQWAVAGGEVGTGWRAPASAACAAPHPLLPLLQKQQQKSGLQDALEEATAAAAASTVAESPADAPDVLPSPPTLQCRQQQQLQLLHHSNSSGSSNCELAAKIHRHPQQGESQRSPAQQQHEELPDVARSGGVRAKRASSPPAVRPTGSLGACSPAELGHGRDAHHQHHHNHHHHLHLLHSHHHQYQRVQHQHHLADVPSLSTSSCGGGGGGGAALYGGLGGGSAGGATTAAAAGGGTCQAASGPNHHHRHDHHHLAPHHRGQEPLHHHQHLHPHQHPHQHQQAGFSSSGGSSIRGGDHYRLGQDESAAAVAAVTTAAAGGQLRFATACSCDAEAGACAPHGLAGAAAAVLEGNDIAGGAAGGAYPAITAAGAAGGGGGGRSGPVSVGEEFVTITKREYELLLLKDKAMNVLQEGITIADCSMPDMPLIYANAGFVRTTGHSVESVIGKNCRFLQGEGTDSQPVRELKEAITQGRACVVQLLNYKKNGDPFVNYLSVTPIHDTATGRLTHYVGVQSDITELVNHKKAELAAKHAALQAAVATEAKSQFLARMSHEIRTPLNGMIAVGQLLAETSLTPAQWDLVNTIRCSGETLLTLITDILDFSRIEANKMVLHNAVFKLDTVIEAAMEIAGLKAAQRGLQVAYHVAENMPRVLHGDAQRLQQILLNILNNGIKFTEEGELLLEVWPEGTFPPNATAAAIAAAAAPAAAAASDAAAAVTAASGKPVPAGEEEPSAMELPYHVAGGGNDAVALQPDAAAALDAAAPSLLPAAAVQPPAAVAGGVAGGCAAAATGPEADWPLLVLRFSVRDTGIGIAPADLGRLFNSFTQVDASATRRYGGSGLGLAISRKLCEAMGGQMWAESQGLSRGSTFSWTIICRLPQQAASKRKVRRTSLVCVSRPPAGSGSCGLGGFALGLGSGGSGPGSSVCAVNGSGGGAPIAAMPATMTSLAAAAAAFTSPRGQSRAARGNTATPAAAAPLMLPTAADEDSDVTSCRSSEGATDKSCRLGSASSSAAAGPVGGGVRPVVCTAPGSSAGAVVPGFDLAVEPGAVSAAAAALSPALTLSGAGHIVTSTGCIAGDAAAAAAAAAGSIQRSVSCIPTLPLHWTCSPGGSYAGSCAGGRDGHRSSATGTGPGGAVAAGGSGSLYDSTSYGTANLASALASGGDLTASLPLLRGKKILLVEPCTMVRQVLMLALHSWGCRVCAVPSSQEAVRRLVEGGTLAEGLAPPPPRQEPPRLPSMTLRHADAGAALDPGLYDTPGPYDCVIMDMKDTALLRALMRADDHEAQRLVFMGWPGENEPEEDDGGLDRQEQDPGHLDPDPDSDTQPGLATGKGAGAADEEQAGGPGAVAVPAVAAPGPYDFAEPLAAEVTARPPRAVTEEMSQPQNRQLGYVTVTRPVRQGRLKLALEEVLMMALDGGASHHESCWSDDGEGNPLAVASLPPLPYNPCGSAVGGRRSIDISSFLDDSPLPLPLLPPPAPPPPSVSPSSSRHALVRSSSSSLRLAVAAAVPLEPPQQQLPPSPPRHHSEYQNQKPQQHQLQPRRYQPLEATGDILRHAPADVAAGAAAAGAISSGPDGSTAPASPGSPATWCRNSFECAGLQGGASMHGGSHGHGHATHGSLCSSLRPAQMVKSNSNADLSYAAAAAAAAAAVAAAGGEAGGGAAGPGRVRILLAEDNAINMKVALGILRRTLPFAEVTTAENGVRALEAVSARGGIDEFDLVLMDLHMPVMGGMEAVAELEKRYPNRRCRVVAVTADAFEDTRDSCLAAGFDGWLTKPFRIEDLVRVVGEHLVAARAPPPPPTSQQHHPHQRQLPHHHPHHHQQRQAECASSGAAGTSAVAAQHRQQQQQPHSHGLLQPGQGSQPSGRGQ